MKRILIGFIALMLAFPVICSASLGAKLDGGVQIGIKTINFTGPDSLTKTDGALNVPIVDSTLLAAGTANGGVTSMVTTTLAVPLTFSQVNMTAATDSNFNAKTLADGKKGQILILNLSSQQPSAGTITVTPATSSFITTLSFNAIDDKIALLFVDTTYGWLALPGADSVTVTP